MRIETERLIITEFTLNMAEDVHLNSLDEDNRRFVPDEVFETPEEARDVLADLISGYGNAEGPWVYPILTKRDHQNIGYVQLAPIGNEQWEIGYHIAKRHTGKGYATEAVQAFLPEITRQHGISQVFGICLLDNVASVYVLKKCGFEPVFEGTGDYQGEKRPIFKSRWTL